MLYTGKMKRDATHVNSRYSRKSRQRTMTTAFAAVLAISAGLGLTGCFSIGGSPSSGKDTQVDSNTAAMVTSSRNDFNERRGIANRFFIYVESEYVRYEHDERRRHEHQCP